MLVAVLTNACRRFDYGCRRFDSSCRRFDSSCHRFDHCCRCFGVSLFLLSPFRTCRRYDRYPFKHGQGVPRPYSLGHGGGEYEYDEYPKCPVRDKTNTEESPYSLTYNLVQLAYNIVIKLI